MRILLVNDDGMDCPGINILAERLADNNDLYIITPLSQRSAAGHGISLSNISFKFFEDKYAKMKIAIDGTPADCVKAGVLYFLRDCRPDLVIAGINDGPNVGAETFYSGTVSCALEASYLGIKSLAVSNYEFNNPEGYKLAADFISKNLEKLLSIELEPFSTLNINYPAGKARGVRFCRAASNYYTDHYVLNENGQLNLVGMPIDETAEKGTDYDLVNQGYITIVPLCLEKNMPGFKAVDMEFEID